jgi:hypothetical protein
MIAFEDVHVGSVLPYAQYTTIHQITINQADALPLLESIEAALHAPTIGAPALRPSREARMLPRIGLDWRGDGRLTLWLRQATPGAWLALLLREAGATPTDTPPPCWIAFGLARQTLEALRAPVVRQAA